MVKLLFVFGFLILSYVWSLHLVLLSNVLNKALNHSKTLNMSCRYQVEVHLALQQHIQVKNGFYE